MLASNINKSPHMDLLPVNCFEETQLMPPLPGEHSETTDTWFTLTI